MELRPDAAAPRVTPGARRRAGCCCTCRTRARTCPRGSARTSCSTTRSSPPRSRRSPTTAPTRSPLAAAERAAVRPWVLVNPVSRFVVDVERFPDEREEMAAVGMGAVYTRGTRGQRIRRRRPRARRGAVGRVLPAVGPGRARELRRRGRRAVLLDVHSYPRDPLPYERHADGPRPPVCLGTDPAHTPSWLVAAARDGVRGVRGGPGQPVLRRLRARGRLRRPRSWWRSAATSTPPGRPSWWRALAGAGRRGDVTFARSAGLGPPPALPSMTWGSGSRDGGTWTCAAPRRPGLRADVDHPSVRERNPPCPRS